MSLPSITAIRISASTLATDSRLLLPAFVDRFLIPAAAFIILVGAGLALRSVISTTLERHKADSQVRVLVKNITVVLSWLIALVVFLSLEGVNLSLVLTLGGVAGLAVGLAFQDLLRNVLAGIFLLIEHPFRIGDQISIGEQTGTVETISLRTTVLKTPSGLRVILPNLTAFTGTVINASAHKFVQRHVVISVPDKVDALVLTESVQEVLNSIPEVEAAPAPTVQLALEGATASLVCKYWISDPEGQEDVESKVAAALYTILREKKELSE